MPTDEKQPNSILLGGPDRIPHARRLHWVDSTQREFKLRIGNRYEHFVSTDETTDIGDRSLHVFRWSEYTKVAE